MNLKIFSIYDSKIAAYGTPFFARSTGEALRQFTDIANSTDQRSLISSHPEDYTLFEMGGWSDETAAFDDYATPVSIAKAHELKKAPREEATLPFPKNSRKVEPVAHHSV